MKKYLYSVALLLVGIMLSFDHSSAQTISEILNSSNLLRSLQTGDSVPPCSYFTKRSLSTRKNTRYCPVVASNCPAAYPLCTYTRYKKVGRKSTYVGCKCSSGFTPIQGNVVEPCASGTSCAAAAVILPTPTPGPTSTSTVTPTIPSGPSGTIYLTARNERTGITASSSNSGTLVAKTDDKIQYSWGATGALQSILKGGDARWFVSAGPNNCKNAPDNWPATEGTWATLAADTSAGGLPAVVSKCQVGTTYRMVFRPKNSAGQIVGEANVYIKVE
jgi:hypothetical protein